MLYLLGHCINQMHALDMQEQQNADTGPAVEGAAGQAVAEATLAVVLALLQGVSEDSGKTAVAASGIAALLKTSARSWCALVSSCTT